MMAPTAAYLDKARQALKEARAVADIGLPEAAGRAAYLAAYHAAQAFIFARARKVSKTHSGVRSEFARLAKDYNLKSIADYAVGVDAHVSPAEADEAIKEAARFVKLISSLLLGDEPQGAR